MSDRRIVFVVDDESVISETLAIILNNAGYLATAFDDPRKALEASTGSAPDLVITDVMMPGMTGIELAAQFRQSLPQCKIILCSGQPRTADLMKEALDEGHYFDLLAKPIHPTELLTKLRSQFSTESPALSLVE